MGFEDNIDRELAAATDAKPWWKSKVIWLNLAALGFAAIEANIGMLQGHLPSSVLAWLSFCLPVVNIVLRFATKLGVRL